MTRNGRRVMGAVLLVALLAAPAMAAPTIDGDGWLGWLSGWWSQVVGVVAGESSTEAAAPKDGGEPDGGTVTTTGGGEDGGETTCAPPEPCTGAGPELDPHG